MKKEPIAKWRWCEHWSRSLDEALAELEREAHVRIRCFDRWVAEGKVSQVDAWDRMERILSAVNYLRLFEVQLRSREQELETLAEQKGILAELDALPAAA